MTQTNLFPRRSKKRQFVGPAGRLPRHRGVYDVAVDIVRKNSTVVPARHSSEPDTMRAVFPR